MKSQFARIKNRASSVSTRALAVMLCFVMLLTAVGAGTMMTAIAAGGAASPVTDAAQKVIDIADSVDVSAAAAAEDEAPTETVFDKLKKQLSELSSADADDGAPAPKKKNADLAETGDTTYYMHIGVQSAFRTGDGIEFTYDAAKGLYYASYALVKDKEYPMVICTTSGALTNDDKSSSNQSVTTKNSTFNPDRIQFDYFQYNTNNYDGYDCFKFKTQTSQTVYFTFTSLASGLVVRSSLEGVTPETPTESSKVYFAKPASGWGNNVYVHFYNSTQTYWDTSKGTGSQTGKGCLNTDNNSIAMTVDSEYPEYFSADLLDGTKYVAFTNLPRNNYEYFWGGSDANQDGLKVAIKVVSNEREEFSSATPVYTPSGSTTLMNGSDYYLSGTWSALPEEYHNVTFSQPTGGTITVNGEDHGPISVIRRGTFTVNVTPDHGFVFKSLSVGSENVTVSEGSYTGTMGTSDIAVAATFEYAGKVTDADLIDVLDGDKIMFYFGEPSGWDATTFYINTSNSTSNATASASRNETAIPCAGSNNYKFAPPFCLASRDYYMGHWDGGMHTTAYAGQAYVIHGGTGTITGHTKLCQQANSTDNSLYRVDGGTVDVETTFPGSVYQGYTAPVATGDPGKSVLGLDNTIEYYVKDGTNYYEVEADNGYIDTSAFAVKNGYKLITVLKDERDLRVVAHTNDFDVVAPVYYNVKVKSNNDRLGTATVETTAPAANKSVPGQVVTLTIKPNMGTYTADSIAVKDGSDNDVDLTEVTENSVYKFVMPFSNATVTLTFSDYSEDSNFYYNSYETSGSPSATNFGARMTEGKLGGVEFSYFHVEGRSGSDQLFTVSYGSPDYTSAYVYFQVPDNWTDTNALCCNHAQGVYFLTSDEVMVQDWTEMSWDRTDGNKKQWKALIPDGARYAYFKDWTNSKQTVRVDLKDNNGFYVNGSMDGSNYQVNGFTNNDGLGRVGNMFENFNGTGKYTNGFDTKGFTAHNANRGGSHAYSKPTDLGTNANDYYILVLYKGKTYNINGEERTISLDPEVIWMDKLPGTEDIQTSEVNVYGKDGSIVIDWDNKTSSGASTIAGTAYGYSIIADTKIYDAEDTPIGADVNDDGASYEKAKVVVSEDPEDGGTQIKIKTTIDSTWRGKYYVRGWCIDGVTYKSGVDQFGVNTTPDTSNGEYEMTYTIPAGTADDSNIEITPIYYLVDSSNTITFILEGYSDSIQTTGGWGNTPYIYPFYGDNNNIDNSFGVYPGQPMVFDKGKYSIEVPLASTLIDSSRTSTTGTTIKGVTISNGYADHVHRNIIYKWTAADNDAAHKQTYDYDDFYKIYNEQRGADNEQPNSIIFRMIDESAQYNRYTNGGSKSGARVGSSVSTMSSAPSADAGNGYQLLTNRYDEPVNIYGNKNGLDDSKNPLYVVSTGYNANIAGDYGTAWMIYKPTSDTGATTYSLITCGSGDNKRNAIPPSLLSVKTSANLSNSTYPNASHSVDGVGSYTDSPSLYKGIYDALAAYTDRKVYIMYEQNTQDTRKNELGTGADRIDGRWFYTFASDYVQSTIIIELYDKATGQWTADTFDPNSYNTVTGASGCTAKFSNNSRQSASVRKDTAGGFDFSCEAGAGWQFDSWQIKFGEDSYQPILGATAAAGNVPADANDVIVARFVPAVSGDLTIIHDEHPSSTGVATRTLSAIVRDGSGVQQGSTYTPAAGSKSIYIPASVINNSNLDWSIQVTLSVTPDLDDNFVSFGYDRFNTDLGKVATENTASATKTSLFTFTVSDLYDELHADQLYKTLTYTSLVEAQDHYYSIDYHFTDRSGAAKTYTLRGTFNRDKYKSYISGTGDDRTMTNAFIMSMKPFQSNFNKNLVLNESSIVNNAYNSASHMHSAEISYTDTTRYYSTVVELPYATVSSGATDDGDGNACKAYTALKESVDGVAGNVVKKITPYVVEFDNITYGNYLTSDGTQNSVSQDPTTVNHTGNKFLTAPDEIYDGTTKMYFKYWGIYNLSDNSALVEKVYYNDFNYRVYGDYYIKAEYSTLSTDSYKLVNDSSVGLSASILFIGDTRNQFNDKSEDDSESQAVAADMIYNDFAIAFSNKTEELKNSDAHIGIYVERVYKDDKPVKGSTTVSDMTSYAAAHTASAATSKAAIETWVTGGCVGKPAGLIGMIFDDLGTGDLNNKNRKEVALQFFSRWGQTVDDTENKLEFKYDSVVDDYLYRAYAYISYKDSVAVSEPVYFSMRYTANR